MYNYANATSLFHVGAVTTERAQAASNSQYQSSPVSTLKDTFTGSSRFHSRFVVLHFVFEPYVDSSLSSSG
jgi:hypothetical protein